MLWIHPIVQVTALFLALYVLTLGWARFAFVYLDRKGQFLWKRHVAMGKAAIFIWIYGAAVGAAAAWVTWRTYGVTGFHFTMGLAMILLILIGYFSGWYMDTHKAKRKVLPLIHAGANLTALMLFIPLLITGTQVIRKFLLQP